MTIQNIPSKGRISVIKIQNFTIQKRKSLIRVVYGTLAVIVSIVMASIDPVEKFTNWYLQMSEGSFVYEMWKDPTYDVTSEIWVYNYTNVNEYLSGKEKVLKVEQVGPFKFREHRTNTNMSIDAEKGVLRLRPNTTLEFLPEESVAHYRDVVVTVPSIAILAISTLVSDKFGFVANSGVYYAMKAIDPRLFRNMTVEKYFWGYYDPIVIVANKFLPGWIDFKDLGILDRFYAHKDEEVEVELRDPATRYSIRSWGGSLGLKEQGYTDLNTSTPCNRIVGAYEGLMVSSNWPKGKTIPVFRKQACRIYPFIYENEGIGDLGIKYYRYTMDPSAFNRTSEYACKCTSGCLPDGFVDISNCYYGFPISLSKPHFLDTDPVQQSYFEGMHPDPELHKSTLDIEPIIGAPLAMTTKMQVNLAVRSSLGNPLTRMLNNKILPLVWLSLAVKEPPPDVAPLLRLRFVIAPPLVITIEVVLFTVGLFLTCQGLYRIYKPRYQLIDNKNNKHKTMKRLIKKAPPKRRTGNVVINMSFNKGFDDEDDDMTKEACSLLSIKEDNILLPHIDRNT